MAVLTNTQILEKIKAGSLSFTPPLDAFQLHSHSVDLRLGFTFMIPKQWTLTPKGRESISLDYIGNNRRNNFEVIELEKGQYFEILPEEYILVSTLESLKMPNDIMCVLFPRSSTNRRGLSVDLTGIVDAGYEGPLTIPIRNNTKSQTIRLYPGERFCQLVFQDLNNKVEPRQSKYHKKDVIEGYIAEQDMTETEFIAKGDITGLKKFSPQA